MAQTFFFLQDGQECGPVTASQLRKLATNGKLQTNDKVRKEGMDRWVIASVVKGLFTPDSSTQLPTANPSRTELKRSRKPARNPELADPQWVELIDDDQENVDEEADVREVTEVTEEEAYESDATTPSRRAVRGQRRWVLPVVLGGGAFLFVGITVLLCVLLSQSAGTKAAGNQLSREEFTRLVEGKSRDEVRSAVGSPDSTFTSGRQEAWQYSGKTIDSMTGKVDYCALVIFDLGPGPGIVSLKQHARQVQDTAARSGARVEFWSSKPNSSR